MPWTTPETFTAGQTLTAASMNIISGDLTELAPFFSAWTSYTPSWTSTGTAPALGNGTATGRYLIIGKTAIVQAGFLFGSTTTYGTGSYRISVPSAAPIRDSGFSTGLLSGRIGGAYMLDTGNAMYSGNALWISSTTVGLASLRVDGTFAYENNVTNTVPITFASGDGIFVELRYEIA